MTEHHCVTRGLPRARLRAFMGQRNKSDTAMFRTALLFCLLALPHTTAAQDSPKFRLDGTTLHYTTEDLPDDLSYEIEVDDVDLLRTLLRANPDVTQLVLTSTGGSVWAGNEMAHIVQDFALDTTVDGECSSSCVTIFLAGDSRQMTRGSKIGFHQRSWSSSGTASYYERWREDEGWDSPFDFASWIYRDTQTETWKELTYMISRGVDPEFAIETKRSRSGIWFPTRLRLEEAGVLHTPDGRWLP